jgi:hypothetical protein
MAIGALDEDRVRAALLTAITMHIHGYMKGDPAQFARWVETQ